MVQLSLMETLRDKASKLLPTPYMEAVEECTAPQLATPAAEHVRFLCDSAMSKPEAVADIVRAVRRRLDDDDAAVRHLTLLVLDALIRHGGPALHVEVASQKGLLRDVVNAAVTLPTSARGMRTREAALALVLNLSIWFASYPDARCSILTTLVDDVRTTAGTHVFDGTTPDVHVRLHLTDASTASPSSSATAGALLQQQQQQQQQRRSGAPPAFTSPMLEPQPSSRHAATATLSPPRSLPPPSIVTAVPVNLPTEETITSMLDTCITLNEYLGNLDANSDGSTTIDDVVVEFRRKLQDDHDYVTILLSSDLDVNRDLLRSISDSQSSVLRSVAALRPPQEQQQQQQHTRTDTPPARPAPPAATATATVARPAPPPPPPPQRPPPSVDDIFGPPVTAEATPQATATTTAAVTAPVDQATPHDTTTAAADAAAPAAAAAHDAHATPTTTTAEDAAADDAAAAAAAHEAAAAEEATDERAYAAREEQEAEHEHTVTDETTATREQQQQDATPAAAAAIVTTDDKHGNASDDDDFDAFIDKHATR